MDNNVWVIEMMTSVVIDAPHDVDAILEVVGDRRLTAIICTHAHDDHVLCGTGIAGAHRGARIMLHPDDRVLWEMSHPDVRWDADLADGQRLEVGGTGLVVLQ